jgi:hypothetical protein
MRFYQLEARVLTKTDENSAIAEVVTTWFGTERDAIVARNEMFKAGKLTGLKRESEIQPIDVPTDKAGLFKFLTENVKQPAVV